MFAVLISRRFVQASFSRFVELDGQIIGVADEGVALQRPVGVSSMRTGSAGTPRALPAGEFLIEPGVGWVDGEHGGAGRGFGVGDPRRGIGEGEEFEPREHRTKVRVERVGLGGEEQVELVGVALGRKVSARMGRPRISV